MGSAGDASARKQCKMLRKGSERHCRAMQAGTVGGASVECKAQAMQASTAAAKQRRSVRKGATQGASAQKKGAGWQHGWQRRLV